MGLDVPDPVHLYQIRHRTGSGNLPGLFNSVNAGKVNKHTQKKKQREKKQQTDKNKQQIKQQQLATMIL